MWRWELGRDGPEVSPERMRVVSITWSKYRVDATINKENLLQRIHTLAVIHHDHNVGRV